jgi:hypothetical protein
VSRKRKPTVDDLYDATYYRKPPVSDNAPESSSLTPDERAYIEAGLSALALLRKTFESWVTVGRAIQTLREKADRMGTRKAFARLLEQQGFGEFNKDRATCTRLLRVIENLGEVSAWHAGLEPKQQKAWAHPSTVFLHCPIFKKPKAEGAKPNARAAKSNNHLSAVMAERDEYKAAYEKLRDERAPGAAKAELTFDQAVEILIANLAAMPQAKALETMKGINHRISTAWVAGRTRNRTRKNKGENADILKDVAHDIGAAIGRLK